MGCQSLFRACLAAAFVLGAFYASPPPSSAATPDAIIESHRPSKYAEIDFDRPGQDYTNFEMDDANVNTCEFACTKDAKCKAWTYVKPGVQGPKARCWLKATVPSLISNKCCISGLKAGICDSGSYWDAGARECRPKVN